MGGEAAPSPGFRLLEAADGEFCGSDAAQNGGLPVGTGV